MKRFEVHAGWMPTPELIGICNIENARGKETISFSYTESWLVQHSGLIIDPDIYPMTGRQYPPGEKNCFGFLADIAPDRWGRTLMKRKEAALAREENRAKRTLMESDFILGVSDVGRIGGIRLYDPEKDAYISDGSALSIPPVEMLRKLEDASIHLEDDASDEGEWLKNLIEPGSSLGGARPKANVIDEKGNIWIAKFPSKKDEYDVGAWEMVAHELALRCGLDVPRAELKRLSKYGSTYMTERFDRDGNSRIHYASAMTMLGQTDDSNDDTGYIDIAEVIERICERPTEDLNELWNRMIFNICISNTDDHLRNHGFVLSKSGWRLSKAFDINPSIDKEEMSLYISGSKKKSIDEAIDAAEYFRLTKDSARQRALDIRRIIADNWRFEADKYHIPRAEQKLMEPAFINV